jgi:hypothetical protein
VRLQVSAARPSTQTVDFFARQTAHFHFMATPVTVEMPPSRAGSTYTKTAAPQQKKNKPGQNLGISFNGFSVDHGAARRENRANCI